MASTVGQSPAAAPPGLLRFRPSRSPQRDFQRVLPEVALVGPPCSRQNWSRRRDRGRGPRDPFPLPSLAASSAKARAGDSPRRQSRFGRIRTADKNIVGRRTRPVGSPNDRSFSHCNCGQSVGPTPRRPRCVPSKRLLFCRGTRPGNGRSTVFVVRKSIVLRSHRHSGNIAKSTAFASVVCWRRENPPWLRRRRCLRPERHRNWSSSTAVP